MDPRDFFGPANYECLDEFGPMDDPRGMPELEGPPSMFDPRERDMGGPFGGPPQDPLGSPSSRMYDPVRDEEVDYPGASELSPPGRHDYPGLVRGDFPRDPPGGPMERASSPRPGEGNEYYPRDLHEDEFLGQHREPNTSPSLRGTWTDDGRQIHSMLTEPHPTANAPEGAIDYVDSRRGVSHASMYHSHPSEEVDDEFIRERDADPMWSPEGSAMRYNHGRMGYRPPGFYGDEETNPGGRYR